MRTIALPKTWQLFLKHNVYVKAVVPKKKLLIFKPTDGYKQLCEFLGKTILGDRVFPRMNWLDDIRMDTTSLWWSGVVDVARKFRTLGGAVVADVCAVCYCQSNV